MTILLLSVLALPAFSQAARAANAPPVQGGFLPTISTAPPSPERMLLDKLMTENALEREKNLQKLKNLTDERDELAIRSAILAERQKLATADDDTAIRKLQSENGLASEKNRKALAEAREAYDKLVLDDNMASEKGRQALLDGRQAYDALVVRENIATEKNREALAEERKTYDKLSLDNNLASEQDKQALAEERRGIEKLKLDNDLKRAQLDAETVKNDAEKARMDMDMRRLEYKARKLRYESDENDAKSSALKTELDLREKKEKWRSEANRDPDYEKEPFKDGRLTVSDRRIPLNGPIIKGTAQFVTERIEYYNNKSEELPIFIVIDNCPGGSVMEGYRIVKAMRASKAPIHVVVKSFAASMAAVITTLAPRSYAYPNAIILHHQMSGILWGNITMQKEQLEMAKEWYRRLAEPVAQKMGVSVDELVKEMYKHNSEGDWEEFADKAQKLKWVDTLVSEIRETGIVKEPSDAAPKPEFFFFGMKEEVDAKGQRFVQLPRLDPFDFYYLYNPDQYYR